MGLFITRLVLWVMSVVGAEHVQLPGINLCIQLPDWDPSETHLWMLGLLLFLFSLVITESIKL